VIRVQPGDLVAVAANQKYYYALILDRRRLFGGNWTYAFHHTSTEILKAEDVLGGPQAGFHAFVDFIWAKREGRLVRLARKVDPARYAGPGYLKGTNAIPGRLKGTSLIREEERRWFIRDMNFREIKKVKVLSAEERQYPLNACVDDTLMSQWIDKEWTPDQDERI
jgi:hypothetical protein